jgi:hypothetical protein
MLGHWGDYNSCLTSPDYSSGEHGSTPQSDKDHPPTAKNTPITMAKRIRSNPLKKVAVNKIENIGDDAMIGVTILISPNFTAMFMNNWFAEFKIPNRAIVMTVDRPPPLKKRSRNHRPERITYNRTNKICPSHSKHRVWKYGEPFFSNECAYS